MQLELVLKLLGSALAIWESHEKNQFLKQYMKLNTRYYEEINKPKIDHAVIDNLTFELSLLITAVNSKLGK